MLPSCEHSCHQCPKRICLEETNKNLCLHSSCRWFLLVLILVLLPQIFLDFKYFVISNVSLASLLSDSPQHAITPETPTQGSSPDKNETCPLGRVYVYDLPPVFNNELLHNCSSLEPWSTRYCDAVLNGGFGQRAIELIGVVPERQAPAWYWTDQFMSEVIFHNKVQNYACRTSEPESATAFYIPFYAGLAVGRYLFGNHSSEERDRDCEMLLRWVQDQQHWKRSNGSDHFITLGRIAWDFRRYGPVGWGSGFINMPEMRNVLRLVIERSPWDPLEIGVPYPTGFHPRSNADVLEWQRHVRTHRRASLFCFVGATRGAFKDDFRGRLLSYCKNESDSCRAVDCAKSRCHHGSSDILETFLASDFCLQPRGDSYTRRSMFDCMVAGSIPVLFWEQTAYDKYQGFLPEEHTSYSVFIDYKSLKNGTSIRKVLERFSSEEVRKMREKVVDLIPKIVYAKPQQGSEYIKDASDVAIEIVLRRLKKQGAD